MARVLVIDDERGVRFTLAEFLRGDGHEVETAADAPEAVALLAERAFDVVVTDIILPRISGLDLLDQIRAAAPDSQLVVITGEPTVATAAKALRARAYDYLPKPVTSDGICKAVAGAAEMKTLADENRRLGEEVRRHRDHLKEQVEVRTQQLRESEEHYRGLTDQALLGIGMADVAGRITYLNGRLAEILGVAPERAGELLGESFLELIHPEDRGWVLEKWTSRTAESGPGRYELRFLGRDGVVRWAEVLVKLIVRAGKPGTVANVIDITERRAAEEALRASENRYRSLVETAPFGLLLTDAEARIVEANSRFCEVTGVPRDEVVGKQVHEVVPVADLEALRRRGSAVRAGERVPDQVFVTPAGRAIRVSSSLLSRDPVSVLTTVEDVTDRHRLEEHLLQAQKMDAVGTLAGGVAHDINNVLGTIMGAASLLQGEMAPDDPKLPDIQDILAACRRGRELTRNLLGFARPGRHRREPVAVNQLVESVVKLLARTVSRDVEIRTVLDPELPPVSGDPRQIHHVIVNVCLNAVDAVRGEGTLTITTRTEQLDSDRFDHPELEAGTYCVLRVVDDGVGMDRDTLARAFEPFYTSKNRWQASGLGLSMVYGTIRNHGGLVTLDSAPGCGTTVSIYLPVAGPGELAPPEGRPPPAAP